jgi:hypothetical protein
VTSLNGFNSAVTLSCLGQPAGVSCNFGTNPVTPPSGGSAISSLTVNVGGSTAAGTYNFQVQGTSGATIHGSNMTLNVTGVCVPAGGSCTANSQCCSNRCKGKPGVQKCQ